MTARVIGCYFQLALLVVCSLRQQDDASRAAAVGHAFTEDDMENASFALVDTYRSPVIPDAWKPMVAMEFVRKIGSGSQGEVYSVTIACERPPTPVAIKVYSFSDNARARDRESAINEASLLEKLDHENIIRGFRHVVHETHAVSLMEAADNDLKRRMLIRGAMGPKETLHVFEQILEALAYMHRQGITHRDVKPANIFFSGDNVKVGDFGLACSRCDGAAMGTPSYMSPEALGRTSGETVSVKDDMWSLGVILFEILVGQHPWSQKGINKLAGMNLIERRKFMVPEEFGFQKEAAFLNSIATKMSSNALLDATSTAEAAYYMVELLRGLLTSPPEQRTSAQEALVQLRGVQSLYARSSQAGTRPTSAAPTEHAIRRILPSCFDGCLKAACQWSLKGTMCFEGRCVSPKALQSSLPNACAGGARNSSRCAGLNAGLARSSSSGTLTRGGGLSRTSSSGTLTKDGGLPEKRGGCQLGDRSCAGGLAKVASRSVLGETRLKPTVAAATGRTAHEKLAALDMQRKNAASRRASEAMMFG